MNTGTRIRWYRDLLIVLTRKELAVRYKSSILGYLWSIMNPLLLSLVFYVVFGLYMRFDIPNYLILLLSGLFPWQWISNSVGKSPEAFLENASLIKKVAFPRYIIPLVITVQDMIHFLLSLMVYVIFFLAYRLVPGWIWIPGIPLLLILTQAIVFGLALILSSINLFFRDLGHLVEIGMMVLFYGSPIIYPLERVPEMYHFLFKINPVAPIIISWRSLLFDNRMDSAYIPWAVLYAILFLSVGILIYSSLSRKFAEVV